MHSVFRCRLRVGHGCCLIVSGGNCLFVKGKCHFIEWRAVLCVPSKELIAIPCSCRCAEMSAVIHTEGKGLCCRTPGKVGVIVLRRYPGMQESTILDLAPLRVDNHAVHRHRIKGVFTGTSFVHIPAFKNVTCFTSGKRSFFIVESADICTKGNIAGGF